jgi:hypothetical protein
MLCGQEVRHLLVVCGAVVAASCGTTEPSTTATPTPTPTVASAVSVTISGPDTCYPYPSCSAAMTASGSNYTSLTWGGCCSGTAATSTCEFTDLAAHTCTITAVGPGGTATASKTVAGANVAPQVTGLDLPPASCNADVTFQFTVTDEEKRAYECLPPTVTSSPPCVLRSVACPTASDPSVVVVSVNTGSAPAGSSCSVSLQVRDRFGAESNTRTEAVFVSRCP